MNITINFDMDGTIADLYGVEDWLPMLRTMNPTPYAIAKPLLRLNVLARYLNALQANGATINVLSWLSKGATPEYNEEVIAVKREWLSRHLPSVEWDNIYIIPYGTPKENYCLTEKDVLFDDELKNRVAWNGVAFNEQNILKNLKKMLDKLPKV